MKIIAVPMVLLTLSGCALDIADEGAVDESDFSEQELALAIAGGDHCIIGTIAVADKGGETRRPPHAPRCFQSFAQAISFATGGRVELPPEATPEDLDEAMLSGSRGAGLSARTQQPSASPYVIGIEFVHSSFQGPTLTITSSVTCSGYSHSLGLGAFPAGWNDTISSALAFSNCNHSYHYEHDSQGGAVIDCGTACSYIGDAMNDRTSSLRWTQ